MFKTIRLSVWLGILAMGAATLSAQTNAHPTGAARWEKEIAAYEASDRTNMPPKHAILFLGSSTIRKWTTLSKDFPGKQVINRGFGGSEIAESTEFADRIVFPYEPRIIVFYAGDNDLASGKSVDKVFGNFEAFLKKIHEHLPDTTVEYISIKPCPQRWKLKDKVIDLNDRIAAIKDDKLVFINIYPMMLGEDGKPKADLFLRDGLHPSEKCYQMWAKIIAPHLD